jgi:DNA-binding response OmpR family regulator
LQTKILVVEDDNDINRILRRFLERESYGVVSAYSGTEARLLLSMDSFDLIILDLMLPGITGEELIGEIRRNSQIPILVISAKIALEDKVNALKTGADDYMSKPFEREEVLARVEALLRRSRQTTLGSAAAQAENDFTFKNLILKPIAREVIVCGNAITLTAYEFDILHHLLKHPEQVFTKEQLYQDIWKAGYFGEDNTINVHVSNIRKKIKEFDDESYIRTVWGIGFKIDNA